ncbi:tryptophan--tRNA ligase [bacterium]|nr:tryptophan--tRNA ligase [bacterium]
MNDKKILFSGVQPTGDLHLGNYLGAFQNWVNLQDKYNCIYSVVDLHAITINYDPEKYQERVLKTVIDLLAMGIDPQKSILFVQSQVPEHTELCWLLNTITPVSELQRMTQFKDKSKQNIANVNMGLFDYPVLQVADILLYKSEFVPVGADQVQHLELTNDILKKFNNKFGEYFSKVETIISKGERIMSLADPSKKMSKSLGENHCLSLRDDPDTIRKKIMSAITDQGPTENGEMSAGVDNLFKMMELLGDEEIVKKFHQDYHQQTLKYSELKIALVEVLINFLKPIQEKILELENNSDEVVKILEQGTEKARAIARVNIREIKEKMGLV